MIQHTDEFIQELLNLEEDQQAAEQWQGEQDRPASALELFEQGLTKSDLKVMAAKTVDSVLNQGNILQVAEAISAMECYIKEVKDDTRFKAFVREEAGKTPKGFVSNSGAKIELIEAGTSYDFANCNDAILLDLVKKLDEAEKQVKERKEFLKALPLSGMDIVTPDFEILKIYPPAKSSVSSYKITLAK